MNMYSGESSQVEVPTTELVRPQVERYNQANEEALLVPLCSTEMNSEQTTEVRTVEVELNLENYERFLSDALARSGTFYRDAHGNIICQVHPGLVTPRGGSNAVPVEPNDGTIGVGGRPYDEFDTLRAELARSTIGARGPPFQFMGVMLNDVAGVHRAYSDYMRAAAHSRSTFSAGSGYFNETMSAEASPGFAVLGGRGGNALGVEPSDDINGVGAEILRIAAHLRSTNSGDPSAPFNEIMSAEASSNLAIIGGGGSDALGVELNDAMLTALRSTARAMRGHGGSQDLLVDEAGGRFLAIHIHPPQQGDQGLVAAARRAEDCPGDLTQRALQSIIGGLVPACLSTLSDDNFLKAGGSPRYIKTVAYAGLGLVTVFTFLGLASKKRAKAAIRVVASTSMATVSIALVYNVSENVYIKCVCGIIGGVATLATMAIDW